MSSGGISTSADDGTAEIETVHDMEDATSAILKFYANTKGNMDVCVDLNWFSIVNDVDLYNKEFRRMKARGVKFRIISEITTDNISNCRKVMGWAEVRHIDNVSGNLGLSETEFIIAISPLQHGKPVAQIITTSVPGMVQHQQKMFDILWDRAVPAAQKVAEIKEGTSPDNVEIVQNRERAELLLLSGIKNAKSEVLAAVHSYSFLARLADIGLIYMMEQAKSNGAHIIMICPNISPNDGDTGENKETLALIADIKKFAEVQEISGAIKGSVFVFDNKEVLALNDEEKGTAGIALFSNNRSLITNYSSLFATFWNERETFHSLMRRKRELQESNAELSAANEQLKVNDRLQKEFINIAAHELRTPVQPILGVLDMYDVSAKAEEEEEEVRVKKHHLRMIARNAVRLARLSSDILDATKIESDSLKLEVDRGVSLVELASDAIEDAKKSVGYPIEFILNSPGGPVLVDGDQYRLTEVFANLLSNALKFTPPKGTISLTVEKTCNGDGARTTVADTGSGISPAIMPRLFQKFASKTDGGSGTGLGLFISKAIVEAHGGRMWAENNGGGKGATFYFTLPLGQARAENIRQSA